VHSHLRTHGCEGATEPGRDEPGPVSPSRPAWPSSGVGSAPLAPEGSSTLSPWRRRHSRKREPFTQRGHPQARAREGRSPEGDRPSRKKHPQVEKKEDTVERVTMINSAMSSTLMG
jgi:hypothetical protein